MLLLIGVLFQMFRSYKLSADFNSVQKYSVKEEYRKEIKDAYSAGWRSGFNAFMSRVVTTEMVDMESAKATHAYMKEVLK
jgi:hypothetical protein